MKKNKNNGSFPLYSRLKHQNRFRQGCCGGCKSGIITPKNALLPFQIITTGTELISAKAQLFNACNDEYVTEVDLLEPGLSAQFCSRLGVHFIHFGRGLDQTFDCGLYYWIIELNKDTINEAICFSEVVEMRNILVATGQTDATYTNSFDPKSPELIRLNFSECSNANGIVYENDFVHHIYIDALIDVPQFAAEEEVIIKGDGSELIKSRSLREYCTFKICDVMDDMLMIYNSIRSFKNISVDVFSTAENFEVEGFNFTSTKQDDCFSLGTIQYQEGLKTLSSCCESEFEATDCIS